MHGLYLSRLDLAPAPSRYRSAGGACLSDGHGNIEAGRATATRFVPDTGGRRLGSYLALAAAGPFPYPFTRNGYLLEASNIYPKRCGNAGPDPL